MALFFTQNEIVKKIPTVKIGLEKNIQKIFEKNLDEILDITFLATEYSTSLGGRMDTVGIDNNGSPVIIEYKLSQNGSVINQGLSYLLWLLDHKDAFETLVRKMNINIEIDWASPRVICVAESYNKFDLDTADLLPMNIELLRYRLYENNILVVESETQRKVKISTSDIFGRNEKQKNEFKEKIQHTLDDHLKSTNNNIKELFAILKENISALDELIIEEPKSKYIAYKLTTNFCDVVILKDSLKIFLNIPSGNLNDPSVMARDLTKPQPIGHWGNGDYEVKLEKKEDIEKVMDLIKQSYIYNK
ncbi:MAG: Transporter [Candidatus Nomurabacteria bacterium GW2011_GWF2_35_12]|uniref:Transporter n=3 Tax=Candidatus Nomuraibacteriota TaxID=1752729 RepID=A0A0G0H1R6_9BACT|nr:MAG: Transporter [Candidatus Nomurabacteria bacterium GW2011_GWF2_35_12]KKP71973.1 MAG: Transporter [Candidatus Nomurabacteria bacterium GW2011_GWB1_35_20]KKP76707.1 MAG: Transporter [Parcubacteria group bacterium GW2011_GWC1_35_21]KKP78404.1 MAG: Transporter [Candidatus Nomurabacteria bacterium GW2011_GWC2_35_35]KKP88425.1 MAG: Transporter [Candidatus Nomurabacteria bacterium GW2011_GWA2_35_80]KKP97882.1 MAG: Transporter [Candidatus Nomurabacteria bacterium GW2011_GWA1_36_15]